MYKRHTRNFNNYIKNSTPLSLLSQALEPITLKPCLTAACHHVHEVIMKQLVKKNPVIINNVLSTSSVGHRKPQLACPWESGLSVPPHWTGLGPITVTMPSKTHCCHADGISPFPQSLSRPNRPDWKILEPCGKGGGSSFFLMPNTVYLFSSLYPPLARLLSLRQTLSSRCCGSLQSPAVEHSLPNWQWLRGGDVHLLPVCTN